MKGNRKVAEFGDMFRDHLAQMIQEWDSNFEVYKEVNVGYRFRKTPRKLDIVIRNRKNGKFLGIECKAQLTPGSTDEKLAYALEDCTTSPIPTIIALGGDLFTEDLVSKLVMSGYGILLDFQADAYQYLDPANNNKPYFRPSTPAQKQRFIKNPHYGEFISLMDPDGLFRQRVYIELEENWIPFATGDKIEEQRVYWAQVHEALTEEPNTVT